MLGPQSSIYENTLVAGFRINANVLDSGAAMFLNTLAADAYIYFNTLEGSSNIASNALAEGALIEYNSLHGLSNINQNTLGLFCIISSNALADSNINSNTLIEADGNSSSILYNTLTAGSMLPHGTTLANKTLNAGIYFSYNIIGINIDQTETCTANVQNKRAEAGFSNFEVTVNVSAGGTLTIPAANNYCGIINITGSSETFDEIQGFPTFCPYTLYPANGVTVTLIGISITTPPAMSDIVFPVAGSVTLNGTNQDLIVFEQDRSVPTPVGFSLQIDVQNYT
jgi:hypothetical protein